MPSPTLTTDDLEAFHRDGFVRLREAFPRESALKMRDYIWSKLKERCGIDREDRATWQNVAHGLAKTSHRTVFKPVGSPRLFGAINQLLGEGAWENPKGWGGFLVSFPQDTEIEWDVIDRMWHWDGDAKRHLNGLNGVFVFTFYSDVRPNGGGTLAVRGSHRLINSFLKSLSPDDFARRHKALKNLFYRSHPWIQDLTGGTKDSSDRIRRFMDEETEIDGVPAQVVELTGEPGDAIICHPTIFHAPSFNRADAPRFMRVKAIGRPRQYSSGSIP